MLTLMQVQPTGLQITWFILIAVLWIGFFFLEGFDFGVAMLYPIIGKDPKERRVMINSIGPTWDGNEVWLLTAGGATFAAFPGWYSTLFSGLYLPLFLVLIGLIIRGVAFEYRAKMPDDAWRDTFDWCATIGSFIVTLVFGVGFANFLKGMPVAPTAAAHGNPNLYTGGFWALFSPFALVGGIMLVLLFALHGAVFLTLKTYGSMHAKASGLVTKLGPIVGVAVLAYVLFANIGYGADQNPNITGWGAPLMWITGLLAVVLVGCTVLMHRQGKESVAFIGTGGTIVLVFVMAFIKMFGTLGFLSADASNPLDMVTASSSTTTLTLMTWFAGFLVPVVLAYQIWSYYVFRKRLSTKEMPPVDASRGLNKVAVASA